MAYQVFRHDPGTTGSARLGQHIDGDIRPKTAKPRDGLEPVVHIDENGKPITRTAANTRKVEGLRYLDECVKASKSIRGPKPDPLRMFLIAGPPAYRKYDEWKPFIDQFLDAHGRSGAKIPEPGSKQYRQLQRGVSLEYFRDAVQFVLRRGGPGTRIVRAVVHQDETSPHLHLVTVLADEKQRLGWNRVKQGFAREPGARGNVAGKKIFSAVQDRFHEEVASRYGLQRGGASGGASGPRKREPINREDGIDARVDEELALREANWKRERERTAQRAVARSEKWDRKRKRLTGESAAAVTQRDAAVEREQVAVGQRAAAVTQRDAARVAHDLMRSVARSNVESRKQLERQLDKTLVIGDRMCDLVERGYRRAAKLSKRVVELERLVVQPEREPAPVVAPRVEPAPVVAPRADRGGDERFAVLQDAPMTRDAGKGIGADRPMPLKPPRAAAAKRRGGRSK